MSDVVAKNREVRFFGILRESPAFHFYLLQAVAFLYLAFRFASRNYTVYGILPDEAFDYPRAYLNELWPLPPLHFPADERGRPLWESVSFGNSSRFGGFVYVFLRGFADDGPPGTGLYVARPDWLDVVGWETALMHQIEPSEGRR